MSGKGWQVFILPIVFCLLLDDAGGGAALSVEVDAPQFTLSVSFDSTRDEIASYLNKIKGSFYHRCGMTVLRTALWLGLLAVSLCHHVKIKTIVSIGGFLLSVDNAIKSKQVVYSVSVAHMEFLLEKLTKDLSECGCRDVTRGG